MVSNFKEKLKKLAVYISVFWYALGLIGFFWLMGNWFTFFMQDYFIFRPKKLKPDFSYQFEALFEEVFIPTPQHGTINALWFRQVAPKGLILFFHGNAGSLERWGHLHYFFRRLGYDFFVYDYRGYGKSTGIRTEQTMFSDALAVFDFVKKHYSYSDITLFGRSLGSVFASVVASEHPVKNVILETPFYSMRNLFYTYYPLLPRIFFFKYPFHSHLYLQEVQCPIYIFQGTYDWVVPYKCAARLKKCLKPTDAFYTIPGGGHNNLLFYDIYNRQLQEILK